MTDLTTMTPAQIAALTPAELAAYPAADLGDLGAAQVGAITSDQMAALSAEQLTAIGTAMEQWQALVLIEQYQPAAFAARTAPTPAEADMLSMIDERTGQ